MKLKIKFWINDPKTGEPSVSLTLLVISFIAILIASFMSIAELTNKFGMLQEIFYSMVGLYFLTKANIKTKYFDSSSTKEQTPESVLGKAASEVLGEKK